MSMNTPRRQYIDIDTLMNRIRTRIIQRGATGIRGIGRLFRIADDNGDKLIDLHNELPKLMNDIGVILNKTELAELARHLDKNGDGHICFEEFLFHMAPPMSESRISWCNKAYNKLDANGDGHVSIHDLQQLHNPETSALVRAGKTSATAIFNNLSKYFDGDGDGIITREEFIDYYREISPSIDNDEYFALMMQNAWKL